MKHFENVTRAKLLVTPHSAYKVDVVVATCSKYTKKRKEQQILSYILKCGFGGKPSIVSHVLTDHLDDS